MSAARVATGKQVLGYCDWNAQVAAILLKRPPPTRLYCAGLFRRSRNPRWGSFVTNFARWVRRRIFSYDEGTRNQRFRAGFSRTSTTPQIRNL